VEHHENQQAIQATSLSSLGMEGRCLAYSHECSGDVVVAIPGEATTLDRKVSS